MNWINATERKPDTTRKVFVRGIVVARHSRGEEEWLAVASWHEFDKRWSNINTIRPDDTARTAEPSHWAEITDILTSLDTAEPENKAEIGVHTTVSFDIISHKTESGLSKGLVLYEAQFSDRRKSGGFFGLETTPFRAIIERCNRYANYLQEGEAKKAAQDSRKYYSAALRFNKNRDTNEN